MGMPLADATQWQLVEEAAAPAYWVYQELQKQAANANVLHNDDTSLRILEYIRENLNKKYKERTGSFTTAMIALADNLKISLFFSGRKHAGENLLSLLKKRDSTLGKIITMNDAAPCAMPRIWMQKFVTVLLMQEEDLRNWRMPKLPPENLNMF